MQGIKAHTHEDRTRIVNQLVEILEQKFKDNLVAIAAEGSYARGNDKKYSDLELTVFLKTIPENTNWNIHKIVDGQLIVIIFETKESFIQKYLSGDFSVWYASGAEDMLAITNKTFIDEINKIKPKNIEQKCLEQIKKRWPAYQEVTAKLLNNIDEENTEAISLIFPAMFKEILVILAYLNQTPYITLSSYISQARKFKIKLTGFDELVDISIQGKYTDIKKLGSLTQSVFSGLESLLEDKDLKLYTDSLDDLW